MRAFPFQLLAEVRVVLRRRESVVFALLLPVLFLLFFGALYGNTHSHNIKEINFLLPGYVVLAILGLAFNNIGITIANERQAGILKRLGSTPLPRFVLIAAKLLAAAALIVAVEVVLFGLGIGAYGASPKGNAALIALLVLLGIICFAIWGITFGGMIKPDAASAAGPLLYLTLAFLGGVFIPLDQFPSSLINITSALPSERMVDALQQVMTYGHGLTAQVQSDLIGIALWCAAGIFLASQRFRWQ